MKSMLSHVHSHAINARLRPGVGGSPFDDKDISANAIFTGDVLTVYLCQIIGC